MVRAVAFMVAGAVLLAALFVAGSPYWTVHQMRSAAEAGDAQALSAYVDFPAVRASLKDQFESVLDGALDRVLGNANDRSPLEDLGAALGGLLGGLVVERVVDSYVTPASLASVMATGRGTGRETTGDAGVDEPVDVSFGYDALNTFSVMITNRASGDAVTAVLRRPGIVGGWRLTELILPLDELREAVRRGT